jgi:hypothetical protein
MNPIDEIAPPAFGLDLLPVLLVFGNERFLLVVVGLEQEGAGLVKGAAQALEQFTHAGRSVPSTEGFLDPVAHGRGALEAPRGHFPFESVALGSSKSTGVAFILEVAQGIESLFVEEGDPVADRARADVK